MIKTVRLKRTSYNSWQINVKEVSGYKYVSEEFFVVTITHLEEINRCPNDNFYNILKSGSEGLIGLDQRITNSGYYLNFNPHVC